MSSENKFCPTCGQKNKTSVLSIRRLVLSTFADFLNIDSKLWMTLRDIWIPAKLSLAYVAGEREKYMKPGRFLLVTALLYFALLVFNLPVEERDLRSNTIYTQVAKENMRTEFDSLQAVYPIDNEAHIDSIRKHLFTERKDSSSLYLLNTDDLELFYGQLKNYPILKKDVAEMTSSAIFEKYNIESYFEKLVYGQFFKIYKDRLGALKFAIGNMAWTFILSIFLMAMVMKLLYIRHGMFYVEHVIFFIHYYSFAFLIFILFGGYEFSSENAEVVIAPVSFGIISVFFFIALKRYYQQGYIKTFLKALTIFIAFFLVIALMAMLILTISAFFF